MSPKVKIDGRKNRTYSCNFCGNVVEKENGWLALSKLPKARNNSLTLRFCNWHCINKYTDGAVGKTSEDQSQETYSGNLEDLEAITDTSRGERKGFFSRLFTK